MRVRLPAGLDPGVLVPAALLCIMGLVVVYSATGANLSLSSPFVRQVLWLLAAAVVSVVIMSTPPKTFHAFAVVVYVASVLFLMAVLLLPAGGSVARRWIHIGPANFQPSELAKFGLVLILARVMSDRRFKRESLGGLIVPVLLTAIPFFLVLVEPDLGTSLVFGSILLVMLFWSGVKPIYLFFLVTPIVSIAAAFHLVSWLIFFALLLVSLYIFRVRLADAAYLLLANPAVGIATPLIWKSLKSYQQKRILAFLNPSLDPWGSGWQVMQSKIAIGSGGFLGKGILHGTQKKLEFLPQRHTDFVFSVIGEELGFLGCAAVLLLFYIMIRRSIGVARVCNNKFASLACIGLTSYIGFQVVVNVGMTLGVMPVAGIPLPFISYGGSSLLFSLAAVGLILSIARRKFEY